MMIGSRIITNIKIANERWTCELSKIPNIKIVLMSQQKSLAQSSSRLDFAKIMMNNMFTHMTIALMYNDDVILFVFSRQGLRNA